MATTIEPVKPGRLLSLDAFRGLTIAAMFLVNNAGDWSNVWPPLAHAKWHGCTATDLIFPFFLFIMGVAMPFSFAKRLEQPDKSSLWGHIIRRSVILFLLGVILMLVAWPAYLHHFRLMGVLQRIGLCYLFASIIMLYGGIRAQLAWFVWLLAIYYFAMKFIPVPGVGAGNLEQYYNLANYIDTKILDGFNYTYNEKLKMWHEPEGLLSTIPAISSTLAGVLCGHWLRRKDTSNYEKVAGMAVVGTLLFIVAHLWKYDIPFNKHIWTPSYVLITTALALFCLGTCYWLIDIKGYRAWAKPFIVYGTNAIAAYFAVSLTATLTVLIKVTDASGKTMALKTYLYNTLYKSWIPDIMGHYVSSAMWGLTYVVVWCGIMWILYKKKIFIKV